jgi:hypothetical protein
MADTPGRTAVAGCYRGREAEDKKKATKPEQATIEGEA